MKNHLFMQSLAVIVLIFTSATIIPSEEFREGKHYKVVERRSETQSDEQVPVNVDNSRTTTEEMDDEQTGNEISVVEYFSYACPVCYDLEPFIDAWMLNKAEDVVFSRVAAPSRNDWIPMARAFYIAEYLGVTDKVHSLIFRAKYENRQSIDREHLLRRMFTNVTEIDTEEFDEAWNSDQIPKMVQNAAIELRDFGITATPTLVVDETYLITPETAGDLETMFEIVDFLVAEIKTHRDAETASKSETSE